MVQSLGCRKWGVKTWKAYILILSSIVPLVQLQTKNTSLPTCIYTHIELYSMHNNLLHK